MSQQLPDANFQTLVSTFATQAAVGLGQIPNPVTNQPDIDLVAAKFAIDLLQLLDEKTKDNLEPDEEKFLQDCLYQLRMVYIDASAKK